MEKLKTRLVWVLVLSWLINPLVGTTWLKTDRVRAEVQNCPSSNSQSIWKIPRAQKTPKKQFNADIELKGYQGAGNDNIQIVINNFSAPDLNGTGYIKDTSVENFKEPINSGMINQVDTKINFLVARCDEPADTVLGYGNTGTLKQNGHLGSDSGNVTGIDGEGNPQRAWRYDLYMVVGERNPNKYYVLGPISKEYDPTIADMAEGIALAKPTKKFDNKGQVKMDFVVSPNGDASKTRYCYITVHQKSDEKGIGNSLASQYIYKDEKGRNKACLGFPFTDILYVEKTLTFNLMKDGLTQTILSDGKIKYNNYFISYARYTTFGSLKIETLISNVQAVEYIWDPVTKTGEFKATGDSIVDAPGGKPDPTTGTKDCPIDAGNYFTGLIAKVVCGVINLMVQGATGLAYWSIQWFLIPAIGIR